MLKNLNLKTKLLVVTLVLLSINTDPLTNKTLAKDIINVQPYVESVDKKELDKRAQILNSYLAKYDSPLQYHAQDFIDAADTYNVNWMLVPSIAGVESTFGKRIPGGHAPSTTSFNAWGWGVPGNGRPALGFKSWKDGIFTVTRGLKYKYIDKGLTDPYKMNRVYAASPTWGTKVTYFLADLENYTKTYPIEDNEPIKVKSVLHKTVEHSAQLVIN